MKRLILTIETHNKIIEPIERDIEALNQEIAAVKASADVSIEILDVLVSNIRKLIFKVTPQLSEHKELLDKQNLLQYDLEIAKKRVLKLQTNHLIHLAIDLRNLEAALVAKKQEKAIAEIEDGKKKQLKIDEEADKLKKQTEIQKPQKTKLNPIFEVILKRNADCTWSVEPKDSSGPKWTKQRKLPPMPKDTTPEELYAALKKLIMEQQDNSDGLVSIDASKLGEKPPAMTLRIRSQDPKEVMNIIMDLMEKAVQSLKVNEAKIDMP
ncbi:hypothetical protein GAMM_40278 [Gammaproteobacteria bacterium]